MGLGAGDERARHLQHATAFDVLASRRWIEKHGDEPQPENREEGDVQLRRHRMKDERRVPRAQSVSPEHPGRLSDQLV